MSFQCSIELLVSLEAEITPNIRKAIDECLAAMQSTREKYPELAKLKYSDYWRKQFGYE